LDAVIRNVFVKSPVPHIRIARFLLCESLNDGGQAKETARKQRLATRSPKKNPKDICALASQVCSLATTTRPKAQGFFTLALPSRVLG
jgi:hypothetical protein